MRQVRLPSGRMDLMASCCACPAWPQQFALVLHGSTYACAYAGTSQANPDCNSTEVLQQEPAACLHNTSTLAQQRRAAKVFWGFDQLDTPSR